jgi:transcriptional regulator GlxA family with amidase domain
MTLGGKILPSYRERMLRNVALVVLDGFAPFEMSIACEVFGVDRSEDGLPRYDFAVVAGEPGLLRSDPGGFTLDATCSLDRLDEADLVVVAPATGDCHDRLPGYGHYRREGLPEPLLAALRRTAGRGGRVLSVCSGAFILGAAGLLGGRRCTTHWRHTRELAIRFPEATVDPSALFVDDDPVITSAGSAAGVDACLYLVRKEQGSRVANGIARRMVVPPQRDGGQAQYIDRPVPGEAEHALSAVLEWMERNLEWPLTVGDLATRAHMSPRTFARLFRQETGTTPQRWITGQRILLAQQLLEETDETVDAIAARTGFGTAAVMRHHFRRWRNVTPFAYRHTFRTREHDFPAGPEVPGGPRAHPARRAGAGRAHPAMRRATSTA